MPTLIPIFPLSQCTKFLQGSDVRFQWFEMQSNSRGIPSHSKGILKYDNSSLLLETDQIQFTCEIPENGSPPQYQCESQLFEDLQTLINQVVQPATPLTLKKSSDGTHVVLSEMLPTNFIESEKVQVVTSLPLAQLPPKFKCKGHLIFQTKLIDLRGKIFIKLQVVKGHATLIKDKSSI